MSGKDHEARAANLLRKQGYLVHKVTDGSRKIGGGFVNNGTDVFGGVDLIAKRRGERMRYIQVTEDSSIGRKRAKLALVPWDTNLESVEIWRWVGGKGKRYDGRTGKPRLRMYFQVYRLDDSYGLNKEDRILAPND